jgi:hypothetical protein
MNALEFLKEYKNKVLGGKINEFALGDWGLTAGLGLGGLHAVNVMRGNQPTPELINQQIATNYGNQATPQSANKVTLVDDGSGNMIPVEVPALSEQDIESQKRYISKDIATKLLTLRQLEAMQSQIANEAGVSQ